MPQSPISVSLSVKVLSANKTKETVSFSFIARFQDGTEKVLNKTQSMILGLRKEADGDCFVLSKDVCSLYFKDWTNCPALGKWDINYPIPLIPKEVYELLPKKSLLGIL